MVTRRQVLGAAAVGAASSAIGGIAFPAAANAAYTTRINPRNRFNHWDGWGASLSWWATVFGTDDALADLFYTRQAVKHPSLPKTLDGLGFNIVRYNVGACTWEPVGQQRQRMVESRNIRRRKQIEGYWLNWDSADPASPSWRWTADAKQRAMMQKARARGADLFEFFSVSPLWWMCANWNPSGAADGGDNLQSWNHRQHAVYLATVAKYAEDNWGINVTSLAPFNEPISNWWKADGPQEGCHVGRAVQQSVIGHLRTELDNRGLTALTIAASDENRYSEATATWNSFPAATKAKVGRVSTHGYDYGDGGRARSALRGAVGNGQIWQSEYGEGHDHGLNLAYSVSLDMHYLRPKAWCYWQPVDSQTWGLVKSSYDDTVTPENPYGTRNGTILGVNNKYYVLAQYTRHIRPGMTIIDGGDQATVAAYDAPRKRLVLVTVRGDTFQRVTYDLSLFATVGGAAGGTVRRWTTDADSGGVIGRQYAREGDVKLTDKSLTVDHQAETITTLEIDNVVA
ncbi:glycoside hydrolase [Actinomadura fulvescens]|uniref:Endo-beta-1,6-galactanase-like domain-containing protein n=1 Tax=Actinomadura fulvescens TaxID=46160 RepID=A0ABP6BRX9_9ACTN